MATYRAYRIVDGKPRWTSVDESGDIINKNPNKEELISLEEYKYKVNERYTDKQLLDFLKKYYKETGRVPISRDLVNNPRYPGITTYARRFKSLGRALKLVGLDVDAMVMQGVLQDTNHMGRLFEIIVRDNFEEKSEDLSGGKHGSPCDGICPRGKSYDAKSSKLYRERGEYWKFTTRNRYKEEIEYYYFGAFNEDWTSLEHVWRVPGEVVDKDHFLIGLNGNWDHNVENMKEYEITDKFKGISIKYMKTIRRL